MAKLRVRKVLMIGVGFLATLVLGAVGGLLLVVRTNAGQAFVVEQVLRRLEGTFNGEIVVSGLRSPGLHRGARILGLEVFLPDGSPVLSVDSVEAEYSIRTLLSRNIVLTDLTLWRPRLTLTKDAPDQPFNVEAFLSGDDSAELELGSGTGVAESEVRVVLDQVEVLDGSVEVRYPLTSAPPSSSLLRTQPGPEGRGLMRVFGFHGIDGHFDGVVADPAVDGIRMNLTGVTFDADFFQEPVRVQDFDGNVAWAGDSVSVNAESVGLLGGGASGSATIALVDGGEGDLTVDAVVERIDLSDLRWLEPRLPEARASARIAAEFGSDGVRATLSEGRVALEGGAIEGGGAVTRGPDGAIAFQDVTLDVSALPVLALEELIPVALPLEGRLYGSVEFSGTRDSVTVLGWMDLEEPGLGPMSAEIDGMLHLRPPLGATLLAVRMIPLDLGLVNRVAEGLLLDGSVGLDIRADGRLDTGIAVFAEATYPDSLSETSFVSLQGVLTEAGEEIQVSLGGALSPLSIAGIFGEESPLSRLGLARGTFQGEGPLSDFVLRGDLTTEGGQLSLESRFDVRSPLASYRIQGEAPRTK